MTKNTIVKNLRSKSQNIKRAHPELVEGYLRALKETLQQVQGERGISIRLGNGF